MDEEHQMIALIILLFTRFFMKQRGQKTQIVVKTKVQQDTKNQQELLDASWIG